MPALLDDSVVDAALARVATGTQLHICTGTPADRAAVLATSLAATPLEPGDFTVTDGDTGGRKLVVAAQTGLEVTAGGAPAHYCVIDDALLLARTEVDPATPDLTVGSTVDVPAWTLTISDPQVS